MALNSHTAEQLASSFHSFMDLKKILVWFEKSCLMLVFVLQSDANTAFIHSGSTELWDKHCRGSLDQESLLKQIWSSPHTVGWPVPHSSKHTRWTALRGNCVLGARRVCLGTDRQSLPARRLEQNPRNTEYVEVGSSEPAGSLHRLYWSTCWSQHSLSCL